MLIDTHTHLLMDRFETDRNDVISRAQSSDVKLIIEVGFSLECSKKVSEFSTDKEFVYGSIGIHPHDAKEIEDQNTILEMEKLLNNKKIIAIGEIGLDYYRNLSPKDIQIKAFKSQIEIALKFNLPIIIHCREAHEDMLNILKGYKNLTGVIHSFSGNLDQANEYFNLGFLLGIGGPITYPSNDNLKNVVKSVSIDNIVVETDCPYLPPQKYRGQRNEPSYVNIVAEEISKIKNLSIKDVENITTSNAMRVFRIK